MPDQRSDPEVIALQTILDSLTALEPEARERVVRYAQERLKISAPTCPSGESRNSTIRSPIQIKQLIAPLGAITVCLLFLGILMLLVLSGSERKLSYPVSDYADLYRMLFPTIFAVTLGITQRRGAYRFDTSIRTWNFFLSAALFCVFPVFLFLVALPVVKTFPADFRWSSLILTGYWLAPIFGIQQTWLLLAQPLKLSQDEAVKKGKVWFQWFVFVAGFVCPVSLLLLWRTFGM